jgi:hypothetical protein
MVYVSTVTEAVELARVLDEFAVVSGLSVNKNKSLDPSLPVARGRRHGGGLPLGPL